MKTLKSLTLACQCYRTSADLKRYSSHCATRRPMWHQRFSRRRATMGPRLIYGLPRSSSLLFFLGIFPFKERMWWEFIASLFQSWFEFLKWISPKAKSWSLIYSLWTHERGILFLTSWRTLGFKLGSWGPLLFPWRSQWWKITLISIGMMFLMWIVIAMVVVIATTTMMRKWLWCTIAGNCLRWWWMVAE